MPNNDADFSGAAASSTRFSTRRAVSAASSAARIAGGWSNISPPCANPPVNASGKMADGRSYDGPEAFKKLLVQDLDKFGEAFVEQLATFALRRAMTVDDAAAIKAIAHASKADDYRLKVVIENFALSGLFQKR